MKSCHFDNKPFTAEKVSGWGMLWEIQDGVHLLALRVYIVKGTSYF